MGFQIEDGTGQGHKVKVLSDNMLTTHSVIETIIAHESANHGRAYVWTVTQDWGADKNAIWIRNDSPIHNLHIERIVVSPPAICQVEIWVGNNNVVAGVEIVGLNVNLGSGNVAETTARHSNTNVDAGAGMTILTTFYAGANTRSIISALGAIILNLNSEIAVNLVTEVGLTSVSMTGYFSETALV